MRLVVACQARLRLSPHACVPFVQIDPALLTPPLVNRLHAELALRCFAHVLSRLPLLVMLRGLWCALRPPQHLGHLLDHDLRGAQARVQEEAAAEPADSHADRQLARPARTAVVWSVASGRYIPRRLDARARVGSTKILRRLGVLRISYTVFHAELPALSPVSPPATTLHRVSRVGYWEL